jgi:hypothetical protein
VFFVNSCFQDEFGDQRDKAIHLSSACDRTSIDLTKKKLAERRLPIADVCELGASLMTVNFHQEDTPCSHFDSPSRRRAADNSMRS